MKNFAGGNGKQRSAPTPTPVTKDVGGNGKPRTPRAGGNGKSRG